MRGPGASHLGPARGGCAAPLRSAPGSLCLQEGRLESGGEPGQGRGLFTLAVHALLGRLPSAVRGDGIGIRKPWWAGPRSGPEGIMGGRALLGCLDSLAPLSRWRKDVWGGSGQFLAPQADVKAKTGEGRGPASNQKVFPAKCLFCSVRDEESWIPASTKPQSRSWELSPLALSTSCPAAVATTSSKFTLEAPQSQLAGGGTPRVILRIRSPTPLSSVTSVDGAAAGICVGDGLALRAQP